MKNNLSAKTLGPRLALLVAELYERQKTIFSNQDVADITGLGVDSARGAANRLVARGQAARLRPGLFILVPPELGHAREYLGDPHVVAAEIVGGADYFISHASAMVLHRMLTQPQFVVYATSTRMIRPRSVLSTEFRFVRCRPRDLFGVMDHWSTGTRKVRVSDPERTVIDGLRQSEYCGGFSEVAKGFWMRRQEMDVGRLVEYALRLDIGAVQRRLGYLLELFEVGGAAQLEPLRRKLTAAYALLDPMLPAEGRFMARWRLRLNVSREEIEAIIGT